MIALGIKFVDEASAREHQNGFLRFFVCDQMFSVHSSSCLRIQRAQTDAHGQTLTICKTND